ncbi:WG repeat-containing protein [Fulvivirga sp. 29W222]|uniref:WG repeat-containing protein n=1 Tax=Fulvivirga marina TaxID=2494733 RepID=A0A937FYV3_9BACT|nr:WG repeat-containing protein [Fulvivirga marina]MBL6447006.1 WG repeat-containing protein [Fulvivirga marina]
MKYFFYLIIFLTSQSIFASPDYKSSDYQLFETKGKQGVKDNQGNVLIPAQYEELGWSKGGFEIVNNILGYRTNNMWGLISLDNQIITETTYTKLYPGNKGLLIAAMKGKVSQRDFLGVLSTDGKIVIPFKYASVKLTDLRAIVASKPGRHYMYGVVDLGGKVIVPLEYKEVTALGGLRFAVKNFEGKTAIFSDKGKQIIGFGLDSISNFRNNLAIIYDNHLRGLIDAQGQIVVPLGKKNFRISNDEVEVLSFSQWDVLDHKNNTIGSYSYDQLEIYDAEKLQVYANGKSWLIDQAGTALTPQHYTDLGKEEGGHFAFEYKGQWGVMKQGGELLIPAKFDSVFLFEDMIYARENVAGVFKWSLYDGYGVKKSNHYYDNIRERTNYFFPVSRQGYWGFIDRAGEEVVHCVYDDVSPFIEGMAVVKFHGENGIIDKFGSWVVLPQKSRVEIINSKYYITQKGKLTTLKSFEEGTVYFTENKVEIKENYLLEHLSEGGLWKIDFEGRIFNSLGEDRYQEVRPPSEGFYAVKIDGKYGFIDAQNRLRIANRYDEVGSFQEGLAAFKLLGRWGFLDKWERIIIQPAYKSSSTFESGLAIVSNDKGKGLINSKGEQLCTFEYDEIQRQDNDRFLVAKSGKLGLLSSTGKLMINAKYDELKDLNNGFAIVKKFGKYGLVNINGVDIIPVMYDQLIYNMHNDQYLAMKKSEWEEVRLP